MKELSDLISGVELVIGMARSVLDDEELADARKVVARLTARRGHLGDTFVLALVGGTGAGKSSLLNSLAGEHVSSVSAVRPHTDSPVAWVPEEPDGELSAFLADLGVSSKATNSTFPGLAIVDLPDQDSVVTRHRQTVWRVLPRADAVAWVVDPDKYRDRGIHEDYVSALVHHQDQAIFILNKVDLLEAAHRADVELDLIAKLQDDGVAFPRVFPVAVNPPGGDAIGLEAVEKFLLRRMDSKRVLRGKVISDVRWTIQNIAKRSGLEQGAAADYEERWAEAKAATAAALASTRSFEETLCELEDFVVGLAVEAGGTFGRRILAEFSSQQLEESLRSVSESTNNDPGDAPRLRYGHQQGSGMEGLAGALEERIGKPLRHRFWNRSYLAATLASVGVDAAQAQAELRR